ncbi:hypothetical protein, partial [Streptosporangium sp. NPDC006007]|uniref:hypothetical protein n=1 Tax=Streptosporangium sp. NPDC006007 TaxID=3154575 RepID=UPI0033B7CD47
QARRRGAPPHGPPPERRPSVRRGRRSRPAAGPRAARRTARPPYPTIGRRTRATPPRRGESFD